MLQYGHLVTQIQHALYLSYWNVYHQVWYTIGKLNTSTTGVQFHFVLKSVNLVYVVHGRTVRSNTNMTGPESVDLISEIYLNHYRSAILNFKNDIFGNLIARSLNLSHKINGTMHFKILLSKDNGPNTVAWGGLRYNTTTPSSWQVEFV